MASRLTRWMLVGVLGFVGTVMVLLPPGVSPLALISFPHQSPSTDPLQQRVAVIGFARDRANAEYYRAAFGRRLGVFVPKGDLPVVVMRDRDTLRFDPALTRLADSIWGTVPKDPRAPKTLLLGSLYGHASEADFPDPGLCVGILRAGTHRGRGQAVQSGAGGCLLAREFGPPGRGLAPWLRSVGTFYLPGHVPRAEDTIPRLVSVLDMWFPGYDEPVDRAPWWAAASMNACLAGRASFCPEALGFGAGGLDSLDRWSTLWLTTDLLSMLPATLHHELGPERFAEVWRSDQPLPVAFARVTGRSFDGWALDFVQHRIGRVVKDNALSWSGWAGWVVWMVLLFAWFAVRLRDQPAQ